MRFRRDEGGRSFFLEWAESIAQQAALIRRDWPIFGWESPDELKRRMEATLIRDQLEDPDDFDALLMCDHRSPEDVLPATEIGSFLAFRLADGDFKEWRWIEEHCDDVDVTEGYAMKRTEIYLLHEKKD